MVTEAFIAAAAERGISSDTAELIHQLRGLPASDIAMLPENTLRTALRRLDYPDMPRARRDWRENQSRGDDGRIAEHGLVAALQELDSLRARSPDRFTAGLPTGGPVAAAMLAVAAVAGLQLRRWQPLGPINVGGRTRSILINPEDTSILWAASVSGGIWRSDDGGDNWAPVDDFMSNLAVTSMVMDPTDANHIYAGTGEGFEGGSSIRGGGIFETRDGNRWVVIPNTSGSEFREINRLSLSSDGQVLLAATLGGLQRRAGGNGARWDRVIDGRIGDVKFHPDDAARAVASSRDTGQSWYTTDGGVNWYESTHAEPWSGRVELCYAAADPSVIYASTENERGTIWRSDDGGQTFVERGSRNVDGEQANYLGDQGGYDNVIWAGDPLRVDLVIVGGIDLWRSTDGGDTLSRISEWRDDRSAHADHHAIVADPGYDGDANRRVWFGNDGGIYVADDVTTVGADAGHVSGWRNRNNGYAVTQFYSAAGNVASGIIIGGTQDNGTLAYDPDRGDMNWHSIFGGDGGFCGADQTDSDLFYGEYVYLDLFRNGNGATSDANWFETHISGHFWNPAKGPNGDWDWKPFPYRIPDAANQRALFIAPFALDPGNSNRLLAGGESLWRTNDAKAPITPTSGPKWSRIKGPVSGDISAIAIDPADSDRVWVGYSSGRVWRTGTATSAAPTWQRIDSLSARRMCLQLYISPHDSDRVLAAFGGFQHDNLWMTEDGGTAWRQLAGLPAAPIRAITIHPVQPDFFYAGTEVGVFASEDAGSSWSPTNEGPANVSVDDLFWMRENLICVTHGRGLFMIDLADL